MAHVSDRLAAWLGDELAPDARAAVAAHLAVCPACRQEADALAGVWRDLGAAELRPSHASQWPAVRARTFGAGERWFYGQRIAARLTVAAAAVACGVVLGVLLPAPGGGETTEDSLWVAASRALDDQATRAVDLWLEPGAEAEVSR